MILKVNGTSVEIKGTISLYDYILGRGFGLDRIAVELNGRVIPQKEYEKTGLQSGDVLEIVSFVGGG